MARSVNGIALIWSLPNDFSFETWDLSNSNGFQWNFCCGLGHLTSHYTRAAMIMSRFQTLAKHKTYCKLHGRNGSPTPWLPSLITALRALDLDSQITTSLIWWFLVAYGDKRCPYGVQIANPIPCLRLASRSSRAAGAVPPRVTVSISGPMRQPNKNAIGDQEGSKIVPVLQHLVQLCQTSCKKKQNQIDNDRTCRKLG